MEVRVLGPVAVVRNGETIQPAGDLQRRLLAMLAARAGASVSTSMLVDVLWPTDLPANPPSALHSQIARLRRAIGDEIVVTDGPGYRLAVEPDCVDAHRFEQLLAAVDVDGVEPDGEPLITAIRLWNGRAYDGLDDVDELRAEAVRLDELRLIAIERLAAHLIAVDRAGEAVASLDSVLVRHPFREQSLGLLMRALHASGRQGDALRTYSSYRRRLADELGLEPSASLRRLDATIAADDSPGMEPDDSPTTVTLEQMTVTYVESGRHPEIPLAVGSVGDGPSVVAVPAWVSSLDVTMSSRDPRSALLERLAASCRVITYDQPGTGLSRGAVTDFSIDAAVADLRAVIEHTGGPVTLLAMSAAGPNALAFAHRHPDLVDRLVLFGTFADPTTTFPDRDFTASLIGVVRARWGTGSGMLAQLYRPGASDDAARRLSSVLRDSADARTGAEYLAALYEADASGLLADIVQPTMVIHYRGDKVIPFRGGEHLARHLPSAQFVPLEGRYHLPDLADVERLERIITRFIGS